MPHDQIGVSLRSGQGGATLLMALAFVAITALASSQLVVSHTTQAQRAREQELLFVGEQYRKAIAAYLNAIAPGGARALPRSLEDLVDDKRFAVPMHHLRRLYPDPLTGRNDWVLIRQGEGILGVHSSFHGSPLKRAGFPPGLQHLEGRTSYAEWTFAVR